MTRSKKDKTVVVDEPVQATQLVEELTTAGVATEAGELTSAESVATTVVGETTTVVGETTTAETIQSETEGTVTDMPEELANGPIEEPEEQEPEQEETKPEETKPEETKPTEQPEQLVEATNVNRPITSIPSQIVTDPLGRKHAIYQPQVASNNHRNSSVSNTAIGSNARRGEILKRDSLNA